MGTVWRAEHIQLGSPVAVKLIEAEYAKTDDALSRFRREAKAAAALRSPHVVQIFDYGVDGDTPYIAMELLEGESLASRLERVSKLSPEDTTRIITQVARAMAKAHSAGIVHRDLKPDNIFLVKNDEDEIAKVLDFGVAKKTSNGLGQSATNQTRTGSLIGTPFYMSPEQAEGVKSVDARTDLWALSVITYECLLGAHPFQSEALGELVLKICSKPLPVPSEQGNVPTGFDAWFARGCARLPEDRFPGAKELARSLEEVAFGRASQDLSRPSAESNVDPVERAAPASSVAFRTTAGVTSAAVSQTPTTPTGLRSRWKLAVAGISVAVVLVGTGAGLAVVLRNSAPSTAAPTADSTVVSPPSSPPVLVSAPPAASAPPNAPGSAATDGAVRPEDLPTADPGSRPDGGTARSRTKGARTGAPAGENTAPTPPKETAQPPPPPAEEPSGTKKRNYGI